VVQLEYTSGAVIAETACTGFPQHALYTACGEYLVIADGADNHVVKVCARSGAPIADTTLSFVRTNARYMYMHEYPTGILQFPMETEESNADGWLVVTTRGRTFAFGDVDKGMRDIRFHNASCAYVQSVSLFHSGAVVKYHDGSVLLFKDRWRYSSRCDWVMACALE
jgi:hypothetical protein